jgi:hypothetical protein
MRHRIFGLCAIVSTLLFLAVLVSWADSYLPTNLFFDVEDGSLHIITLDCQRSTALEIRRLSGDLSYTFSLLASSAASTHRFWGVEIYSGTMDMSGGWETMTFNSGTGWNFHAIVVPFRFLAAPCMVLPFAWVVMRVRRRAKTGAGHCLHCGYDLRASQDRCPECGTATKT